MQLIMSMVGIEILSRQAFLTLIRLNARQEMSNSLSC